MKAIFLDWVELSTCTDLCHRLCSHNKSSSLSCHEPWKITSADAQNESFLALQSQLADPNFAFYRDQQDDERKAEIYHYQDDDDCLKLRIGLTNVARLVPVFTTCEVAQAKEH